MSGSDEDNGVRVMWRDECGDVAECCGGREGEKEKQGRDEGGCVRAKEKVQRWKHLRPSLRWDWLVLKP